MNQNIFIILWWTFVWKIWQLAKYSIKISLLKRCCLYFLMNCQFSEMRRRPSFHTNNQFGKCKIEKFLTSRRLWWFQQLWSVPGLPAEAAHRWWWTRRIWRSRRSRVPADRKNGLIGTSSNGTYQGGNGLVVSVITCEARRLGFVSSSSQMVFFFLPLAIKR